jgi:hypothetical protein
MQEVGGLHDRCAAWNGPLLVNEVFVRRDARLAR